MTKLIPVEDHIIVQPVQAETTTASGIVLTDANKEKPGCGTVIAVGPGRTLDNGSRSSMDVAVGDIVHFTKYAPDEIELGATGEKQKYLVIKHSSVLAIEK